MQNEVVMLMLTFACKSAIMGINLFVVHLLEVQMQKRM
jgi:hypothetical protein